MADWFEREHIRTVKQMKDNAGEDSCVPIFRVKVISESIDSSQSVLFIEALSFNFLHAQKVSGNLRQWPEAVTTAKAVGRGQLNAD